MVKKGEKTKKDPTKIIELLKQNRYNFKKIAKDCGVTVAMVEQTAAKNGIKEAIITPYILELLKKYPEKSYRQISEIACSSTSNVRRVAISCGVERISTKQKIIEMLEEDPNISYPEIAKVTGYSTQNIGKIAREHDLVRHTSYRNTKSKKILEILENNPSMSYADIGKMVNSSSSYVATVASKHKKSNKKDSFTQRIRDIYKTKEGKFLSCTEIAERAGCKPALVSKVISRIKEKQRQEDEKKTSAKKEKRKNPPS